MGTLKITPPTKSSPGYIKRMRQAMRVRQLLSAGDPAAVDAMVEMLRPYVTSYDGFNSIEEAIEEASEADFETLFNAVEGK